MGGDRSGCWFATVIVQMGQWLFRWRAFDLFDYPTIYDGYDIEMWPPSRGWPATGSGWWASVPGIRHSRWRGPVRRFAAIAPMSITARPVFDRFSRWIPVSPPWITERQKGGPQWRPLAGAAIRQGTGATRRRPVPGQSAVASANPGPAPLIGAESHAHNVIARAPVAVKNWASKIAVPVLLTGTL